MLNDLYILLQLFSYEEWNYKELSDNKALPLSYFAENLHKDWDYFYLSLKGTFSKEFLMAHIDLPWQWKYISGFDIDINKILYERAANNPQYKNIDLTQCSKITIDIIKKDPTIVKDYNMLGINQAISWQDISQNISLFNFSYLSQRNDITFPIFICHLNLWDMNVLSGNMCITTEMIEYDITLWEIEKLSANVRLSFSTVKKYPKQQWDWYELTKRAPFSLIEKEKDYPWAKFVLARREDVPLQYLKKKIVATDYLYKFMISLKTPLDQVKERIYDYVWDWSVISSRNDLTWEFIKENRYRQWDWSQISAKPFITFDIVKNHPTIKWDYAVLSYNTGISIDQIIDDMLFEINSSCEIRGIYTHGFLARSWEMSNLSQRPDIRWHHVYKTHKKLPYFSWDFNSLSSNSFRYSIQEKVVEAATKIKKNYILYKQRQVRKKIVEEIKLLPAAYISPSFPGGADYLQAKENYTIFSLALL